MTHSTSQCTKYDAEVGSKSKKSMSYMISSITYVATLSTNGGSIMGIDFGSIMTSSGFAIGYSLTKGFVFASILASTTSGYWS